VIDKVLQNDWEAISKKHRQIQSDRREKARGSAAERDLLRLSESSMHASTDSNNVKPPPRRFRTSANAKPRPMPAHFSVPNGNMRMMMPSTFDVKRQPYP
jgi:hypothetical protein